MLKKVVEIDACRANNGRFTYILSYAKGHFTAIAGNETSFVCKYAEISTRR